MQKNNIYPVNKYMKKEGGYKNAKIDKEYTRKITLIKKREMEYKSKVTTTQFWPHRPLH